ncbi:MAG: DUF3179 domain-containing (seleno)protein [Gemmataceae bacterium]
MFSNSLPPSPRRKHRWFLLLLLLGPVDSFLVLAYWPALADAVESVVIFDPLPPPPPPPDLPREISYEAAGIDQPAALPAGKAPLDDDTPVIGVSASGHARAYLVEAFKHGPESHIVNDLLGQVPISVTHCDVSGCTRVFTGDSPGRTLALSVGGRKNRRLLLKYGEHMYLQETSEPLEAGGSRLPYRAYPAELTEWKAWRQSHPETDVYMGTVEEPTPPEAREPRKHTRGQSVPLHHAS